MSNKIKAEHEDLIYKNKMFVTELYNVQYLYFQTLVQEMKLTEVGEELLYDYLFNGHDDCEDFEHFLIKYNKTDKIYD